MGTLPLRIETGRYRGESLEDRLCILCNKQEIEDEFHFIFSCNFYETERKILFEGNCLNENNNITKGDILYLLFENHTMKVVKYISKAFLKRKAMIYSR